ncbi:hypothetical protein Barb4_02467 [Bacteroidales bacterium Barb4]|nr:hypothetical protein Barb4_02467 [Bacteroidales bacterium Barb4]
MRNSFYFVRISKYKEALKKHFRAVVLYSFTKENCLLYGGFFFDCQLTSVVAAFTAYGMVKMPCAAVGAYSHCGDDSLVVSSSLGCSCMTLSSFRMCHCLIYLIVFIFYYSFQGVPTRVGCGSCIIVSGNVVTLRIIVTKIIVRIRSVTGSMLL